jgi:transcriptional regulator of arginine metabolism
MKLVKGTTGMGTYKYVAPRGKKEDIAPVLSSAITESVVKVEAAQNIVVVKAMAGMANAVAVCIESLSLTPIVGTVAGDDTLLIVVKDSESAMELEEELCRAFRL